MRIVALQVQDDGGVGHLAAWASARGAELEVVRVSEAPELPSPRRYDAAVALGADHSWAVAARPAWMERELRWLGEAEEAGLPVLGICFGAQALAVLHGGAVHRLPEPEVGWIELDLLPGAEVSAGPWLSWHEDVIELPPSARQLARSPVGPHVFEAGHAIGLQFHPEATAAMVREWLDSHDGRDLGPGVRSPAALLASTERNHEPARAHRLFDQVLPALRAPEER